MKLMTLGVIIGLGAMFCCFWKPHLVWIFIELVGMTMVWIGIINSSVKRCKEIRGESNVRN